MGPCLRLHLVNFSKKSVIVSRKCLEELNRLRKQFRPDLPLYRVPPEQPAYSMTSKRAVVMCASSADMELPIKPAAGRKRTSKQKNPPAKKKPPPTSESSTVTKKPTRGQQKKRSRSLADTAKRQSKKPCIDSVTPQPSRVLDEDDVFIMHETNDSVHTQHFYPVNENWQKTACARLGVQFRTWNRMPSGSPDMELTDPNPRRVRRIVGDGNCLFRCFSFLVTGCEEQHMEIRDAILCHMVKIAHLLLGHHMHYSDIYEYIERTKMYLNSSWGTDVELLTFSHLLQTPVYTYDVALKKWWKYSPSALEKSHHQAAQQAEMGMYIQHPRNHYEVVYGVMPPQTTS